MLACRRGAAPPLHSSKRATQLKCRPTPAQRGPFPFDLRVRRQSTQPWVSVGAIAHASSRRRSPFSWRRRGDTNLCSAPPLAASAGKVHGSLARAGKVRGQTPKVPPQEKKKRPRGRAMKRVKYNRRFVNVGE